jgi:hypothetical protein
MRPTAAFSSATAARAEISFEHGARFQPGWGRPAGEGVAGSGRNVNAAVMSTASWNQLERWVRDIDGLRRAA